MLKSRKYIAVPPGETIKEQLSDRSLSQKEFALRMDLSEKHISRLINGEVHLTPDVAYRLEMVLGIPAVFWSNLEAIYRDNLVKVQNENEIQADIEFVRNFPLNEMRTFGWIPEWHSLKECVIFMRNFFEVSKLTLLADNRLVGMAYRRLSTKEKKYYMMSWIQQARREARNIKTNNINIDALEKNIPKLRKLTVTDPDKFCPELTSSLSPLGIAIIFLPHIKGTFLHGVTFYEGKKIILGLTARGKDADKFWFSFFHEIGHILYGHIGKPDGSTLEDESSADLFARETLLPNEQFSLFVDHHDFSRISIINFANKYKILPGIVVGRLQHDRLISFSTHNDLKAKYIIK